MMNTTPQLDIDLGEPRQEGFDFPTPLVEKYRPKRLESFAGLEEARGVLGGLLRSPRPTRLILVGPPGNGKTSLAFAFFDLLPATLHHISSAKADVAAIDQLWENCQFCPSRGKFHGILLDEADEATDRGQVQLLSKLDSAANLKPAFGGGFEQGAPPPIIWIFTANQTYKFEKRFLTRSIVVPCPRPSDEQIAAYLAAIHHAEGRNALHDEDFVRLASVSEGLRDALNRLESLHLREATSFELPPPKEPSAPVIEDAVPADLEEAALQYYGKPYVQLIPAHKAWCRMRMERGNAPR